MSLTFSHPYRATHETILFSMDIPRGPLTPTGAGEVNVLRLSTSPALQALVVHYWLPTWDIPEGTFHEQRILTYPGCNVVIESANALLYGPVTRLSTKRLRGSGRAFGVLLRPGAGAQLVNVPMSELLDSVLPAASFGMGVAEEIQAAVDSDAPEAQRHAHAISIFESWLQQQFPEGLDEEGLLLNRICADIESTQGLQRVAQLSERWQISERSLQRLVRNRMGVTPKWLLQRHRLQEAAVLMGRGTGPNLARLAHALGYADQAHFTRDFAAVTGMSPAAYVRQVQASPAGS